MLQHVVYVAAQVQAEKAARALVKLGAKPVRDTSQCYSLRHEMLAAHQLRIHILTDLEAIAAHLRENAVDLLIYDERHGAADALTALARIKDDVSALAELWGPDFLFPMSRAVAVLAHEHDSAKRTFALGRLNVQDVCIAPKSTAALLEWSSQILLHHVDAGARVGMALSGGGVEGLLFQLGTVFALSKALEGRSIDACDVYSGVSSGAVVSALLAGKVSTREVIRALHRKSDVLPALTPSVMYDLASMNIAGRLLGDPLDWVAITPQQWIRKTMKSIPTGFFKGEKLLAYFREAFCAAGAADSFEGLGTELYVGATDQDSFEHVVFGKAPWEHVPVSEALRASCALPPFFVPAQIDGRWFVDGQVTKTCNIELVVERHARLIFVIDPLKPLATTVPGTVDSQGGVYAMIQMIKALVYTRFESALKHVAERFPDVDFLVFQPDDEAAALMAGSPMRYNFRTQLIHLAFRGTLRRLRERHAVYSAKLEKYGFRLKTISELEELERDESWEEIAGLE